MATPTKPINLFEYQTLAKQQLPQMAWDYYASGSWDEITLRDNPETLPPKGRRFLI
jgi:4-hydroxymandelate oxidase